MRPAMSAQACSAGATISGRHTCWPAAASHVQPVQFDGLARAGRLSAELAGWLAPQAPRLRPSCAKRRAAVQAALAEPPAAVVEQESFPRGGHWQARLPLPFSPLHCLPLLPQPAVRSLTGYRLSLFSVRRAPLPLCERSPSSKAAPYDHVTDCAQLTRAGAQVWRHMRGGGGANTGGRAAGDQRARAVQAGRRLRNGQPPHVARQGHRPAAQHGGKGQPPGPGLPHRPGRPAGAPQRRCCGWLQLAEKYCVGCCLRAPCGSP